MTHSIDAPFPPPGTAATTGSTSPMTTATTTTTTATMTTDQPSTTDVAKDEAKNVGQTAAEAGSQVASTAADQAKEVVQETQRQARDLMEQGRAQLKDQAISQQQKAAQGLTSLAGELRGLADGTSQGAPGPARDLLHQASGMVEQFADKLQNREPAELLDEVRSFARRRPGMFLLGAATAGVVLGRLTSGMKAAHSDSSSSRTSGMRYTGTTTNYVDPAPSYAGYSETVVEVTGTGTSVGSVGSTPLPPPPYGTVPPAGSVVPPTTPAGWDDPARRAGGVG
jgi:hypothetical protein